MTRFKSQSAPSSQATFLELFTPKLVTILREGYTSGNLRSDAIAGLTVAIVALPLSMAIAVACGVGPERGLYTAIIGGFLVSALGGSRFQIGGPAGAFIILVAATVSRHGLEGLVLATFLAGFFLVAAGLLRLGTYIKFIPYPVTVGFTAGIAVIIAASQLRDLFGLTLAGREPGPIVAKIEALSSVAGTFNPAAVAVSLLTVVTILATKRLRPRWPDMLIAVVLGAVAARGLSLPIETIGSRFGELPRVLQMPSVPVLSVQTISAVLPDAVAFALLGAIESLLSAVVADGMTGRRHRSNCELVAQGIANLGSSLFGGLPVTGAIARTATNVRSGAHGPVAGMVHSVILLLFMLVAAPLAKFIPLASLAGILIVVAWNMIEKHAVQTLLRSSFGDAVVLGATFFLTVFRDLTEGILVGFAIGTLLFLHRMSQSISVESDAGFAPDDRPDRVDNGRPRYDSGLASDPSVVIYRISGAFFFGAASTVAAVLDRIADRPKTFILDFSAVPFLDSTAANAIHGVAQRAARKGVTLILTGVTPALRHVLWTHGVRPPGVQMERTIKSALGSHDDESG